MTDDAYQFTVRDYLDVARRRWLFFLLPFLAIAAAAVFIAIWIPPVYQSQGTILIESQQIPDDLIRSTITSYVDERIQVIQQMVMTRENLLRIVDKYGIFGDRRGELTISEQVDQMRERIVVKKLAGDIASNRNRTTISFIVSFEDPSAERAFAVANEMVTLFLEENVKTRTARASETTDFLSNEADKLQRSLEQIEEQIARYKQENGDALPEHLDLHMKMLERTEAEIKQAELDAKAAEDEYRFLQIERSAVAGGLADLDDPDVALSPLQELARAQAELAKLRGSYSERHPDVRRKSAEVAKLRAVAAESAAEADAPALAGTPTRSDLAVGADAARPSGGGGEAAESIITGTEGLDLARVEARMTSVRERIASINQRVAELVTRRSDLEDIIIQTPQVQRALTSLTRDYENTLSKYKEIQAKEMEARLSESLEEGRKAERFSLIEPPVRPERPAKPNRRKIAMLGIILAGGAAFALVFLLEALDHRVRGVDAMTRLFGERPLVAIPFISTRAELERRRKLQWGALGGALATGLMVLVALHIFYVPLDTLAIKIMARLG